jgi:hypothetical protein
VRDREDEPFVPEHLDGPAHRVPGDAELILQPVFRGQRVEMLELARLDPGPENGGKLDVQGIMPVRVEPLASHNANVAY